MSRHQTFENFVCGENNYFAYQTVLDTAHLSLSYGNSLYLYGPSGTGKTHLLMAMIRELRKTQLEIKYITGQQLVDELINAIRFRQLRLFRDRFYTVNMLIIDELENIENKESTTEELCVIFDILREAGKNLVFAANKSPNDLFGTHHRLAQRLQSGVVIKLQEPDENTRIAMVRNLASAYDVQWTETVYQLIADSTDNGFQIQGVVNTCLLWESTTGRTITETDAEMLLEDMLIGKKYDSNDIVEAVCETYGISAKKLFGNSTVRNVGKARRVAVYLLRKHTHMSVLDIVELFSEQTAVTVLRWIDNMSSEMRNEQSQFRAMVRSIEKTLDES